MKAFLFVVISLVDEKAAYLRLWLLMYYKIQNYKRQKCNEGVRF